MKRKEIVLTAIYKTLISFVVVIALVVIVAIGWAILNGETIEPIKHELPLAELHESPMIPAEIKHQAPEPKPAQDPEPEPAQDPEPIDDTLIATITHYCACSSCNGKYSWTEEGVNYTATAIGITLHDGIDGNYCAATFGSLGDVIRINGVDYQLVDRMGSNHGKRIDIFVAAGHDECNQLGKYKAEVEVIG